MSLGPFVDQILSSVNVIEIPIATIDVVYSGVIELNLGEYFAVAYRATSDGAVKLQIQFMESADGTNFVIPEGFSDIESALADEIWHIKKLEPICMPYGKIKITGLGAPLANDASTTLQIKLGRLLL
jgi:hypothetical protein